MMNKTLILQHPLRKLTLLVVVMMLLFSRATTIAWGAVGYDTATQAHATGTGGSVSQTSFTWNHTAGSSPRGVLVFVWTNANADYISTVTYGGTTMTEVSGGQASDTATEPGRVTTFFLGSSVPTGTQAVVVNRTNNATIMTASAVTVTAGTGLDTEVTGIVLAQNNAALTESSVSDGSTSGTNSMRFAATHYGGAAVPGVGSNSTSVAAFDPNSGSVAFRTVRETTAGTGSRSVGFSAASDDRATVHLAVREKMTLSGTLYQTNESSAYQCATSGTVTIALRVNGAGSYSGTCSADTGAWSISNIDTVTYGQTIYVYTSGGSVRGTTVLVSSGVSQSNVHIMQDRVTLRDDVNGSITNTEILAGNTASSDDLITTSGTDVTVGSSYETHIYTGDTYAPVTDVSTGKLHVVGSYGGSTETLTLTASGTSTARPLYVNGGTFTAPATTIFTGTSDTDIEATTFANLSLTPTITGATIYTFLGAETINGNLAINPTAATTQTLTVNAGGTITVASTYTTTISGTTSGISVLDLRPSSSDYNLSTGKLDVTSAGTLDAGSTTTTTITLTGTTGPLFTRSGVFTAGGSTVICSADASVTLTSGTFQTSNAFNNLTLSPALGFGDRTYTFGSGAISINGNFTINPSGLNDLFVNMAGDITVASSKTTTITKSNTATSTLVLGGSNPTLSTGTLVLAADGNLDGSGSSSIITLTDNGTPFTRTGTYTPGSTTITYAPANTSGVTVTSGSYYNLTLNKASNTFSLTTSGISVANDLTITAGVLDVVSGSNYPITVGRNWTNTPGTGGFLSQQGTVTFSTTSTAIITGSTIFHNFTAVTSPKTIQFADATTFQINGLLTLTGSAGPNYITLDSVSGGSVQWTINHQGTENISYASVKNSACDGSSTEITAFTSNGNNNAGNNGTCWVWSAPSTDSALWKFDEGSGTSAFDSSGNGSIGTLAGTTTPSWATEEMCISGKCLYYQGTTAKVTVSSTINTKTVSLWIRPTSTTTTILQLTNSIYINATSGTLTANGFSGAKIYVNGVEKNTIEANRWQHIAVTASSSVTGSVIILGNNSSNYFKGFMDEVKLDSTEYTAAQIKGEFAKRGSIDPVSAQIGDAHTGQLLSDGLVGYWKLDETSGDASDASGNGLTLTNNGTTTYVTGKFNRGSEHVPASSQFLSYTTPSISVHTVCFWTNPDTLANYYINLSSSANIQSDSSGVLSANGFSNPKIYVNGIEGATLAANQWQLVTVTATAAVTVDDFAVGKVGSSNYFDGTMDEVRLYNRVLDGREALRIYEWGPSPVVHFAFDENNGTSSVSDSVGSGIVGDMNYLTSSDWVPGKFGAALDFGTDASTDESFIGLGDQASLEANGNSLTVMAWVKLTSLTNDDSEGVFVIMAKDSSAQTGWSLNLWSVANAGDLCFTFQNAGSVFFDRCTPDLVINSMLNQWVHVAGVFDRDDTTKRKIYINGVDVTHSPYSIDNTIVDVSNSIPVTIGGKYSGVDSVYADIEAYLDEVKIYNYARSPNQILEDMNAGHPVGDSPVGSQVAYWKLNEMQGTTAQDSSQNDNDLTLNTASWTKNGRFDAAWNGTGGSLRMSRTTDADLEFSENDDFAISLWYKTDSANNPSTAIEYLVSDTTGNTDKGYSIYANTDGTICFGIDDDTTWGPDVASCTPTDYYDGNWHQLTAVRDHTATDKIYLYIDGKLLDSDVDTTTTTLDGDNTLYLGDIDTDDAASNEEFAGDIDEVKIYRSSLNSLQAKIEATGGKTAGLGGSSTTAAGVVDNSAQRSYCPPGNSETNCGSGDPSPVGEWRLDENSGTASTYDTSGNSYVGSLQNIESADWVSGKNGSALQLDGSNEYIDIGTGPSSVKSISFWVKPATTTEYFINTTSTSTYIAASGGALTATNFSSPIYYINGIRTASPTLVAGAWHHVVVTTASAINASNLDIGRTADANYLEGVIDQVQLFSYQLSDSQVLWNYNQGKPLAWYKLDECNGTTIYDSSSNGLNGTLALGSSGTTSSGTCTTSGAWYNGAEGKRNASMDFDGTDDYIWVADDPKLDITSSITLSAWVKPDSITSCCDFIVNKDDVSSQRSYTMFFAANSKLSSYFFKSDSTAYQVDSDNNIVSTGVWSHVAVTYDANAAVAQYYVNGKPVKTNVITSVSGPIQATTSNLWIGRRNYSASYYPFEGQIDDVKVFGYALTSNQMQQLFAEGATSFR